MRAEANAGDLEVEILCPDMCVRADVSLEGARGVPRAHGGEWHGSLPVVDAKLKELTTRSDDAQERLDEVLAVHDARRDI